MEIEACRKGCSAFIGVNAAAEFCPVCDQMNEKLLNNIIYYFPLEDRLRSLLSSDLKRFFNYSNLRRPTTEGFLEDIYDGSTWKWFEQQMDPARYGLFFCLSCF
jgi:hypothetical protein